MEWVFAQTGMAMEQHVKDMIEYLVYCVVTAGTDGYMEAFSQKYGI